MARGMNASGDVVAVSADGTDLNAVYAEFMASIQMRNDRRTGFEQLLSAPVTTAADIVPQTGVLDEFEEASEFGEPVSMRTTADMIRLGFPFKDYDAAIRYTWKFLRDATQAQIDSVHNMALEADSRLCYRKILSALLAPATGAMNDEGNAIYGLWNGDGMVPPPYMGNTFLGTHSHMLTSGGTVIDSGDAEILTDLVTEHGYGVSNGTQLLLLVNPFQGRSVRSWRANVANANGQVATADFIPAEGTPAYLSDKTIVGQVAPAEYNRLPVIGSYGRALVIEDALIPVGYVACVATGGPNSSLNPVAFREHVNQAYRGLRIIPGVSPAYPLTGSFYSRSFGCGVRHRGAAAVMQITANAAYTATVL